MSKFGAENFVISLIGSHPDRVWNRCLGKLPVQKARIFGGRFEVDCCRERREQSRLGLSLKSKGWVFCRREIVDSHRYAWSAREIRQNCLFLRLLHIFHPKRINFSE